MKLREIIVIKWDTYVVGALALFLLPLPLAVGWLTAVFIHELFHYLAIRFCGFSIYRVIVGATGITMESDLCGAGRELLCSCAGPAGSALLLLFSPIFPYLSFSALIQLAYNLIPLYPLDGGRSLQCLFRILLPHDAGILAFRLTQKIIKALIVAAVFIFSIRYRFYIAPALLIILLLRHCRNYP